MRRRRVATTRPKARAANDVGSGVLMVTMPPPAAVRPEDRQQQGSQPEKGKGGGRARAEDGHGRDIGEGRRSRQEVGGEFRKDRRRIDLGAGEIEVVVAQVGEVLGDGHRRRGPDGLRVRARRPLAEQERGFRT